MLVNADLKRTLADQVTTDRAQMERAVRTFFHPRPETP
jgi:murein endopeptidase